MENLNLNLPPFYKFQKIIALQSCGKIVKDSIYTVFNVFQCPKCKCWHVQLSELYFPNQVSQYTCNFPRNCYEVLIPSASHGGGPADLFAPIESTFKSITFAEVIAVESPLIGIN